MKLSVVGVQLVVLVIFLYVNDVTPGGNEKESLQRLGKYPSFVIRLCLSRLAKIKTKTLHRIKSLKHTGEKTSGSSGEGSGETSHHATRKHQRGNSQKIGFTEEKLRPIVEAFNILDKDQNGKLSRDEIEAGMRTVDVKMTDSLLDALIESADLDGDGLIDIDEFVELISQFTKAANVNETEMWEAFSLFDKNADGYISCKELQLGMKRLGVEVPIQVAKEMLDEADTDGDGFVDFQEFKTIMTTILSDHFT